MKMRLIMVVLCALALSLMADPFSELSFDAALKEAGKQNKIVLVDFYTTWCGPCKMLDKNTWTDESVIKLLQEKTVPLRIDAEKEVDLSRRYAIEAYPSVLLIKPDGKVLDRLVGYRPPADFIKDFTAALAGKDSLTRAREEVAQNDNAMTRLKLGQTLARQGQDAEALKEYVWCFEHGVERDPGFTGVRRSFLLDYIKNLGGHYPPAQQTLEKWRDERLARVMAGETGFETVSDLIALNRTLRDDKANLTVYDKLPPDSESRKLLVGEITRQLLDAKRYADVLQGADGKALFKKRVDQFNFELDSISKTDPTREQFEAAIRQYTISDGINFFEALAGLNRNQDGKALATDILSFDSSSGTHQQLADAAERAGNGDLAKAVKQ